MPKGTINCKCCKSVNLQWINEEIETGLSFQKISKKLAEEHQEFISGASIQRHALSHVAGYDRAHTNTYLDNPHINPEAAKSFEIDKEDLLKGLGLSLDDKYPIKILGLIEALTEEIALSCYAEIKAHNEGNAKFPRDKFQSLKDALLLQSKISQRVYESLNNSELYNESELRKINFRNKKTQF